MDIDSNLLAGKAAERRKAARRIRTLGLSGHEDPLISALTKELTKPRAWETQYQMIMALGAVGARSSLKLLWDVPKRNVFPMAVVAAGHACMQIEAHESVFGRASRLNHLNFTGGVLRAAAQPDLDPGLAEQAVAFASTLDDSNALYWGLACAQKINHPGTAIIEKATSQCVERYLSSAVIDFKAGRKLDIDHL